MKKLDELKVKIFADGADKEGILNFYKNPLIKGFTTNPTLMRMVGIDNYEAFSKEILSLVPDRPFSLEVFADDFSEMERQALLISKWGENVYVKIPITNTKGESSVDLVNTLAAKGVKLNVTALMTLDQVRVASESLKKAPAAYISVFAGRIADTGRDPVPMMQESLHIMEPYKNIELIWASPRELLNIFHANEIGCHIITVTHDILKKTGLVGKSLSDYSLDTVKMFFQDGSKAGYRL